MTLGISHRLMSVIRMMKVVETGMGGDLEVGRGRGEEVMKEEGNMKTDPTVWKSTRS